MLAMNHKKAVAAEIAKKTIKATKKEKTKILDEFINLTGYNRTYGARVLRNGPGRLIGYIISGGKKIRYVISKKNKKKKKRPRTYDHDVFLALKRIWTIFDFICGKRLAPFMAEAVEKLEKHKEIELTDSLREKLLKVSASTIDRLLKPVKDACRLGKGKKGTKPGTLLKKAIPIKTFADWDDTSPGFVEIDLVSHDGGNAAGDFAQSLNFTDVATCWDIAVACKNKAQVHVFGAIRAASDRFPFQILGIDSDNGSEFINSHMLRYCIENKISFTRSRANKKNDSCFVEQKNYSIVRRAVGYLRYDTDQELKLLNELYLYLGCYTNYFQPVSKLILKTRTGSKVVKKYDKALTPFRRVLAHKDISEKIKKEIMAEYDFLNPAELKRKISRLQDKLLKLNTLKKTVERDGVDK